MVFLDYFSQHPDRLQRLDTSAEFFESCGADPVYVDSERGLVDILTLAGYIALHGGAKLENLFRSIESYLKAGDLCHAKDTREGFSSAHEEIKALYKKDKTSAGKRKSPKNHLPFFLHPETAFGFMRHHIKRSEELYGQLLEYNSKLIPPHARALVITAMEKMKAKNYIAWYLASHWMDIKLQAKEILKPEAASEYQLDVFVHVSARPPEHARLSLSVNKQGEVVVPKLKAIMASPAVLKYLPNFAV